MRTESGSVYGVYLKSLVDTWMTTYATLSCEDYLNRVKTANLRNISKTDWRYFICNLDCQQLKLLFFIVGTSQRYISFEDSHVYVYRSSSKRIDSVRYELVTLYLYEKLKPLENQGQISKLWTNHVTSDDGAVVGFKYNSDWFMIIPTSNGKYDINKNGQVVFSQIDILRLETELRNMGLITSL